MPAPSIEVEVRRIDSLEEICAWLGTYRERLRVAPDDERVRAGAIVSELSARYQQRRAELA